MEICVCVRVIEIVTALKRPFRRNYGALTDCISVSLKRGLNRVVSVDLPTTGRGEFAAGKGITLQVLFEPFQRDFAVPFRIGLGGEEGDADFHDIPIDGAAEAHAAKDRHSSGFDVAGDIGAVEEGGLVLARGLRRWP